MNTLTPWQRWRVAADAFLAAQSAAGSPHALHAVVRRGTRRFNIARKRAVWPLWIEAEPEPNPDTTPRRRLEFCVVEDGTLGVRDSGETEWTRVRPLHSGGDAWGWLGVNCGIGLDHVEESARRLEEIIGR